MGAKITNAALKAACEQMLTENITYAQMDCQAAVEEALIRCGIPASECNLSGSNAHYRKMLGRWTPERMRDLLGVKEVPAGMFMFIVLPSGEPVKYQGDGYGNADHMGIYLGGGRTFNSSSSRGGVEVSTKFNGRTAVPNGGWSMVGWSPWVDCGLTADQVAALTGDANYTGGGAGTTTTSESVADDATTTLTDTTGFYLIKRGCKGGAVRRLQTWLVAMDYQLAVDGDFGPATDNAVRYYQHTHSLTEDGIVGPATWAALAESYSKVGEPAKGQERTARQ